MDAQRREVGMQEGSRGGEPEQGPDLEYDLAHEPVPGRSAERHPPPVQLEGEPDPGGGDYGYDMAHDFRQPHAGEEPR